MVRTAEAVLLLCICARGSTLAQDSAADEDEIRAAMLFNLTKFVQWPAWKTTDPTASFVICTLGAYASGPAFEKLLRDKSVEGRPVKVHRLGGHPRPALKGQ